MESPQQNPENVNLVPAAQPEEHRISLKNKILLGMASLAIIGAAVYVAETASSAAQKTVENPTYSEITMTDNTAAAAEDFATHPSWTQDFGKIVNGSLDNSYWRYAIGRGGPTNFKWGNDEAEYYTSNPGNVQIKDGTLDITARQQNYGGADYTSARIDTDGKVDIEYGEIEIDAKLPAGIGTWPAIWMLSQKNVYYYESPKTKDALRYLNPGEIDIMEEIGAQPDTVSSSAQSRSYNQVLNTERVVYHKLPDASTTFNEYGLEWTPTQLVYTINGKPDHIVNRKTGDTYKAWPYDQPYYLILDDALGGSWGGVDKAQYPPDGINNAALPANFEIRSIDYYPYIGPTATTNANKK